MKLKGQLNKKSSFLKDPLMLLAFGFGMGLSPIMPGTCGTLVAIPLIFIFNSLSFSNFFIVLFVLFSIGVWISDYAEKTLKQTDHKSIVIDEIVSFLLVLYFVPCSFLWYLYAFICFRLFDILKPWPIKIVEKRVNGGLAIMLDDAIAGAMSLVVLFLTKYVIKFI